MKALKRLFIFIICGILIFSQTAFAMKDGNYYASKLEQMGLFKGTDKGYELSATLTREQAATMLTRILGQEENAQNAGYTSVFDDVEDERWSTPYIMYCYETGVTKGTSEVTFSPDREISAGEFVTLVLRVLAYSDEEPETALDTAENIGLISRERGSFMRNASHFTREDMVYVVYRSLSATTQNGDILARKLQQDKIISDEQADSFDYYNSSYDINTVIDSMFE